MNKAVIMARGLGTRMRKATENAGLKLDADQQAVADTGVKALVPVGRPFLDYVLGALADAGITQICIVVGPGHDKLRTYYESEVKLARLTVDFAIQAEPLGTANAIASASDFVGDDDFVALNSDNYYPVEALSALRAFSGPGLAAFDREAMIANSNVPEERVTSFAVIEMNPDGTMLRVLEKPTQKTIDALPTPVGLSMNCWRFDAEIFKACASIGLSSRGEYELTDAVQYCRDELGTAFRVVTCHAAVLDLSRREDIASVKELLAGVPVQL